MVLCLNVVLQGARSCVQLWAPRGEGLHLPLPSPFLLVLLSHSWRFSVWLSARGKQHFILLYLFWGEKGIDRRLAGSSCGNSRALWSSPPLLWAGAQTAFGPQNCRAHVHLCSWGGQYFGELTQGLHSRLWRGGSLRRGPLYAGWLGVSSGELGLNLLLAVLCRRERLTSRGSLSTFSAKKTERMRES